MATDPTEKLPKIQVSSAYPGEWYIVEVDGGDGGLSMELRRPVGEEDSDVFHLTITTTARPFDVKSARDGGEAHTHAGAHSTHLTLPALRRSGRILSVVCKPLPASLIPWQPHRSTAKRSARIC